MGLKSPWPKAVIMEERAPGVQLVIVYRNGYIEYKDSPLLLHNLVDATIGRRHSHLPLGNRRNHCPLEYTVAAQLAHDPTSSSNLQITEDASTA
jgi:hypothetical protein